MNTATDNSALLKVQNLKKYFKVGGGFLQSNQKNLTAVDDISFEIKKGETLSAENIKLTRPGTGIHPKYKDQVMGRKAAVDIETETVIAWDMLV